MPPITDDPNDPRISRGPPDETPVPQNEWYLVMSEEERKKGFVRPIRRKYVHNGFKPKYPLRDLTEEEIVTFGHAGFVKFEIYSENSKSNSTGRFWTQKELDTKGCGAETTMGLELCETYAANPGYYGSTYCTGCHKHRPVKEFNWIEENGSEGPEVGS